MRPTPRRWVSEKGHPSMEGFMARITTVLLCVAFLVGLSGPALRHFYASWLIEQGFLAKKVQSLLGHGSIQMTFDTYGHLFPDPEDDYAKLEAGELELVG